FKNTVPLTTLENLISQNSPSSMKDMLSRSGISDPSLQLTLISKLQQTYLCTLETNKTRWASYVIRTKKNLISKIELKQSSENPFLQTYDWIFSGKLYEGIWSGS